jgi:hypothetical protein
MLLAQIQAASLFSAPISLPEKFSTRGGVSIKKGKMLGQTASNIRDGSHQVSCPSERTSDRNLEYPCEQRGVQAPLQHRIL